MQGWQPAGTGRVSGVSACPAAVLQELRLAVRPSPTAAMKCSYGEREGRSRSQQGAARRRQRRGVSSGGCGTEQLAAPRESLRSYGTATALHGTGLGHPQIAVPAQTMSMV